MPLTSGGFLLFAALFSLLYFILPRRWQPGLLLGGSAVFYAAAGWKFLAVPLFFGVVAWGFGHWLAARAERTEAILVARRADGSWDKAARVTFRDARVRRSRGVLVLGVALVLAVPLIFRGAMLALPQWGLLMPLGMSYLMLEAIGYLADVFRGDVCGRQRLWKIFLYLFYFPRLWQGPIGRFEEDMAELMAPHAFCGERARAAVLRFLWGSAKKLIVADTVAVAVLSVRKQADAMGGTGVLLLIVLYSVQIYADFTGGIDMALGVSEFLGIRLAENFDHPFASPSVREYWRRWHMSMGRWFETYVFYPLSVSPWIQRLSRRARGALGEAVGRRIPLYFATLATWLLTGIWHGFGANFAVWGLCNGGFMLLSRELTPLRGGLAVRMPRVARSRGWRLVCCAGTFSLVGLFRTLDVYGNVGQTMRLWGRALLPAAFGGLADGALWASLGLRLAQWTLVALGVAVMAAVSMRMPRVRDAALPLRVRVARRPVLCVALVAGLLCAILIFGCYGMGYTPRDFIYGRY